MNLDFLTNDFLINENQFTAPIIVTGAGGCIGSWILAILHRSNIPCVAIDLSEERNRLELLLGKEASKIKCADDLDVYILGEVAPEHTHRELDHVAVDDADDTSACRGDLEVV